MGALKNLRQHVAGEGDRKEEVLIRQLVAGDWSGAGDTPPCSPTELVTVALAVSRYDLLPDYYADPLESYFQILDDRQRDIVNMHRSWGGRLDLT